MATGRISLRPPQDQVLPPVTPLEGYEKEILFKAMPLLRFEQFEVHIVMAQYRLRYGDPGQRRLPW